MPRGPGAISRHDIPTLTGAKFTVWGWCLRLRHPPIVSLWTRPVPKFLFTALFLTPMVFNSLFHLGTSVFFRRYSPGTTSALVLFPAVCWHVVSTSSHAGLLSAGGVLAATVIGAAFHTIDLASTTFFLHRKPPR